MPLCLSSSLKVLVTLNCSLGSLSPRDGHCCLTLPSLSCLWVSFFSVLQHLCSQLPITLVLKPELSAVTWHACSVTSNSLGLHGLWPTRLLCPWQEYWHGLPSLHPGDLPDSGIEPSLLCLLQWRADSLPLCHLGSCESPGGLAKTQIAGLHSRVSDSGGLG